MKEKPNVKLEKKIRAYKEVRYNEFLEFLEEYNEEINAIVEGILNNSDSREVFEKLYGKKCRQFIINLESEVQIEKEGELETTGETDENLAGIDLVISELNKHQTLFEKMERKIVEERNQKYASVGQMTPKLKCLVLMRTLGISKHIKLAEWMMENPEAIEKLGFKSLPESKTRIANILSQFERIPEEYIPGEIKEVAEKIEGELKNLERKTETKETDSKKEAKEQKEQIPKCFTCNSSANVVKNKNQKGVEPGRIAWICETCDHHFTAEEEEKKDDTPVEYSEEIKDKAVKLYIKEGKSGMEISKVLKKEDEVRIAYDTILDWVLERSDLEWIPICRVCGTRAHMAKDEDQGEIDLGEIRRKCKRCESAFITSIKKHGKPEKKPEEESLPIEEKIKNYIWGLWNFKGVKDNKEIIPEVNKKFEINIGERDINQCIKEKIAKRNGLTCGQMDCFNSFQKDPEQKQSTVNCKVLTKIQGKDDYICEIKLKKLIGNNDSRLLEGGS